LLYSAAGFLITSRTGRDLGLVVFKIKTGKSKRRKETKGNFLSRT
jgi:hypothetical protein